MKAKTALRKMAKDNFIGEKKDDQLAALVCWGALEIGPRKEDHPKVSAWISEAMKLTPGDKKKIAEFWDNLSSGGAIKKDKIYFGGGEDAGMEFALLINIAQGYIKMTHSPKKESKK